MAQPFTHIEQAPAAPRIGPTGEGLKHYYYIKELGAGNFGVAKLFRADNGASCAVKFLERGDKIDKNVEREVLNHRQLQHPNVVQFREVFLTPSHLGIVMEFASGGELFERITRAKRFSEDEARYFFQQLICGVSYCHGKGICHRDLKLENTLLDGKSAPRVKICDFGYSKSDQDSNPKSTVGTPAYIAPEVLKRTAYDGQAADVWSCGVTLFVMLVGAYPFEDPADPNNFRATMQRITAAKYSFPVGLRVSVECLDLVARMFRPDPTQRIDMKGIKAHPWFKINLPAELQEYEAGKAPQFLQTVEEITALLEQARVPAAKLRTLPAAGDSVDSLRSDMGGLTVKQPEPKPAAPAPAHRHQSPATNRPSPTSPATQAVNSPMARVQASSSTSTSRAASPAGTPRVSAAQVPALAALAAEPIARVSQNGKPQTGGGMLNFLKKALAQ